MTQDFTRPHSQDPQRDQATLQQLQSLNTIGTISYILHLIVAVGALIPGGQMGTILLIVAIRTFAVKYQWQIPKFYGVDHNTEM